MSDFSTWTTDRLRTELLRREIELPPTESKDVFLQLLDRDKYINWFLTRPKPFQGHGRDPAMLVGLHIEHVDVNCKSFYPANPESGNGTLLIMGPNDPIYLTLHCREEKFTVAMTEPTRRWAAMRIDKNLEKAFGTLNQSDKGPLEILEAVVACRAHIVPKLYRTPDLDTEYHDVIGIRCEGMAEMGYIFCKFSPGDEIDQVPIFADVMVR